MLLKHSWPWPRILRGGLLLQLFVAAMLFVSLSHVKADIKLSQTYFNNMPLRFFYFDDSSVVMYLNDEGTVLRSEDEGAVWKIVDGVPEGVASTLIQHPFSKRNAYIITGGTTHYKTTDSGKSWKMFTTEVGPSKRSTVLSFHAGRPDYILFRGTRCTDGSGWGADCDDETYYSLDNLVSSKLLLSHTDKCIWAMATRDSDEAPAKTVLCIEYGQPVGRLRDFSDYHLVRFTDLVTKERVNFGQLNEVNGVLGLGVVKKYIIAAVKEPDSSKMTMFVSEDGRDWDKALFPHTVGFEENAYTIQESSTYQLVVDVLSATSADIYSSMGTLFRSNSHGNRFMYSLNHTNRNMEGLVDYEKVQGVEGIVLANIVANWEKVAAGGVIAKQLQSQISFDDGATWRFISPPKDSCTDTTTGKCALHLHSVTSPHNFGRVFSSPGAPGVLLGVGSVGSFLLPYEDCDTFVSYDGGLSWQFVAEGAHKYEIGDMGSLLVIVDDENPTSEIKYSSDHGKTWQSRSIGQKVRVRMLTTDPESTSAKFLLFGSVIDRNNEKPYVMIQIDFSDLYRKCGDSDYEEWYARNNIDGNGPDCLMGQKTYYKRRKADAQCLVGKPFEDPKRVDVTCPCTDEDYECDFNHVLTNNECVLVGPPDIPKGECRAAGQTYKASSGWVKIPGDVCDGDIAKDKPVEKPCPAPIESPTGEIVTTKVDEIFDKFFYFKSSTVIMARTYDGYVLRSEDDGSTWERVAKLEKISYMFMDNHDDDIAYFFPLSLDSDKVYYTNDQGKTIKEVNLPGTPNKLGIELLSFHASEDDWLLFIAEKNEPVYHTVAYLTKNNGKKWEEIETWVEKCIFGNSEDNTIDKEMIFCSAYANKKSEIRQNLLGGRSSAGNVLQLVSIKGNEIKVLLNDVVEFFMFNEFMAVAVESNNELILYISKNGVDFKPAAFPPEIHVKKEAYTILQSTTGAVFLDAFRSTKFGAEYGVLFKSDGDGTSYSLSMEFTNRNSYGIVDFEKVQGKGLEGIILVNQVSNTNELIGDGKKKIITKISRDDGATWERIPAPQFDNKHIRLPTCASDCYLNLHSRTEISGPGAIFSASSAVGLLMGVGNVGPYLLPYNECNTYLSKDAGHTWVQVRLGESLYEFGDQGTVIVVVDDEGPTKEILYSWDYGESWAPHQFSEKPVRVTLLTTNPKSTSLKFLLMGTYRESDNVAKPVVYTIDFSQLEPRKCKLEDNLSDSDFELWSPLGDTEKCLLGKKTKYYRRKADRQCKIDHQTELNTKVEKCPCQDNDFECAHNYWRNSDGKCELYGFDYDRPDNCEKDYQGSSGYRKISKSVCEGGKNLEGKVTKPCGDHAGIIVKQTIFDSRMAEYFYFEGNDIVIMRTTDGKVFLTENQGYTWEEKIKEVKINRIAPHLYDKKRAYFISLSKTLYYTKDMGSTIDEITLPAEPNTLNVPVLAFHPTRNDWLIFIGQEGCDNILSPTCHTVAYYSLNRGANWNQFDTYVGTCIFAPEAFKDPDMAFCESYRDKAGTQRTFGNTLQLVSFNLFKDKKVLTQNIVGIATVEEYMVIAELVEDGQSLRLLVTVDGKQLAPADFPPNMKMTNHAFTILESKTHAIMLHVTTESRRQNEWGSILKSNSNGTYFRLSLPYVKRDDRGYVDFDKMQGIQGIALANIVKNPDEVNLGGEKQIASKITYNDGGDWHDIKSPEADSNRKKYDCKDQCNLHLHSFTEWRDPRDTFSASSAVGLMMGVGNVGGYLTRYEDGDTFLTRDGGVTWEEVKKGAHLHEIGDQGAILVVVDDEQATDKVWYSFDEGDSWHSLIITSNGERVRVKDIATVPGGTSRRFLLWGHVIGEYSKEIAVHLDFAGLLARKCELDIKNADNDDFELWTLKRPDGESCVFGREVKYNRRIRGQKCYIGSEVIQPKEVVKNCTCTDYDFEWQVERNAEYNYLRNPETNKCELAPGTSPITIDMKEQCSKSDYYYEKITGYRKIPISQCEGGEDKRGPRRRCPGKGYSAGTWFLIILSPFVAAGAFLAYVLYKRRGRYATYGQIRLGDTPSSSLLEYIYTVPITILDLILSIRIPEFISRRMPDIPLFGSGGARSRTSHQYTP
ncbi:2595_t:CDS:10, partial [Paraglomus occultum]